MDSSSLLYKVFGERSDVSGDISAAARALLQRKASTVASIEYLSQCHATINQVPQVRFHNVSDQQDLSPKQNPQNLMGHDAVIGVLCN
jgi:hypothetical protein